MTLQTKLNDEVSETASETKTKTKTSGNDHADRINILTTNIRSLHRNFDELLLLLDKKQNIDIVALSESWVSTDNIKYC